MNEARDWLEVIRLVRDEPGSSGDALSAAIRFQSVLAHACRNVRGMLEIDTLEKKSFFSFPESP